MSEVSEEIFEDFERAKPSEASEKIFKVSSDTRTASDASKKFLKVASERSGEETLKVSS